MAVVLSSEENNYFSTSGLRRSHSQPRFSTKQSSGFHTSSSTSRIYDSCSQRRQGSPRLRDATPPPRASPSPSSTNLGSTDRSCSLSTDASSDLSTLASDFGTVIIGNTDQEGEALDEKIPLSQYGNHYRQHGVGRSGRLRTGFGGFGFDDDDDDESIEDPEPPLSPRTGESVTASTPSEPQSSTTTSRPESPDIVERPNDDTAVEVQPSRQVDYLSHNWKEEDVWMSWRYVISRRKHSDYSTSARLENASWRTWMKSKNKLKTVSPETLNW